MLPPAGADAGLVAVGIASAERAWSVGFRAAGRDLRPVALRWVGGRWLDVSPPWRSGGTAVLTDISVGGEVWAVGYRTGASGPRPYALRWEAGTWRRHDPGQGESGFGALTATASSNGAGTWAAGWWSHGTSVGPIVWQRRDGRWQRETLPTAGGSETVLTGLSLHGGIPWAVGYRVRDDGHEPVVYVRREAGWLSVLLPAADSSFLADDLFVAGGESYMLVGSAREPGGTALAHAVATPADRSLDVTRRPAGIAGSSHLRAVVGDGSELLAVGWTDGRAMAVRTCGTTTADLDAGHLPPTTPLVGQASGVRPARAWHAVRSATPSLSPLRVAVSLPVAGPRRLTIRDVARPSGLEMVTPTYGGTRLDADGDGWDDLLISRHQQHGRLLLGRDGRFAAATGDPLPRRDRHGCAAADVDDDGRDEAYCAVGASRGVKLKSNELFLDLEQERLVNAAGPWGVADHLGRGRLASFMDVDADGHPDLLVTNDPLRVDGLPSLDRLYVNDSGAGFRPAPGLGLDLPVGGGCALSAQLDGKAGPEVAICTDEPWHGPAGLHVFRPERGRYVEATKDLGLRPDGAVDAVAADFDGDGAADIAQLSPSRLVVSVQRGQRLRRIASVAIGDGRALAAGDVNGDGRADLYVSRGGPGNADDRLLISLRSGRAYRSVAIPQARSGGADDVITIDHDRNGLADFLVLNGLERAGPIQLIAAFRPRAGQSPS
jgi:hypothetical protein